MSKLFKLGICKKRGLYYRKWYIKGKGVGPQGGASPYKTLLSTPTSWKVTLIQKFQDRKNLTIIHSFTIILESLVETRKIKIVSIQEAKEAVKDFSVKKNTFLH